MFMVPKMTTLWVVGAYANFMDIELAGVFLLKKKFAEFVLLYIGVQFTIISEKL